MKKKPEPTQQNQVTLDRDKQYAITGGEILELCMILEEIPIRFAPIVDAFKRRLMGVVNKPQENPGD